MKNMMREYLGDAYTNNHLRNFCLYWMKAAEGSGDEWRSKNDLDCLYFDGDLKADTLMSAWTPVKWVADYLNRENGKKFYKRCNGPEDPLRDLKLLAEDRDAWLPARHELVQLLDTILALAEERCNFILLPERQMNTERYCRVIDGTKHWFFDEVPVTLSQIFREDLLGRFFHAESRQELAAAAAAWVEREHLEMGFADGVIDEDHVLPLIEGLDPKEARWLTEEEEIREALTYMIRFLEKRRDVLLQKEMKSGVLMDLYRILQRQEFLWLETRSGRPDTEKLCRLDGMEIWRGETVYAHDPCDIDLPCCKPETLTIRIRRIENGKLREGKQRITVDTLCADDRRTAQELMRENGIRIPSEDELRKAEYDDGVPVTSVPVIVPLKYRQRTTKSIRGDFGRYLRLNQIPYVESEDPGKPGYTFSFRVPDVPGGFVEACIWFYEDAAEVRTYYSEAGAKICKGSDHTDTLLRVLNYINARVFLCQSDGGRGKYAPQMLYTPRMYMTEDGCGDITITTIISYDIWKRNVYKTGDYITAYCPELLGKLSAPVFSVLLGLWSPQEAIAYINTSILQATNV